MQSLKKDFMPVLVRDYHLLHNLLEFLLAASTTPFIFGLYRDEFECLIFYFAQSSTIILSLKFWASLVTIFSAAPYQQIKSRSLNLFTIF